MIARKNATFLLEVRECFYRFEYLMFFSTLLSLRATERPIVTEHYLDSGSDVVDVRDSLY